MKQLGLGIFTYTDQNDDTLMASLVNPWGSTYTWMKVLDNLGVNIKLFACPGDPQPEKGVGTNLGYYIRYSMSKQACPYYDSASGQPTFNKLSHFKAPSRFVISMDRKNTPIFTPYTGHPFFKNDSYAYENTRGYPALQWHGKYISFLHLDGHVSSLNNPLLDPANDLWMWYRTGKSDERNN